MAGAKRTDRLAERIREEVSNLILRGKLHEPGATGILISRVQVTDDLGIARVYLRHQDPDMTEKNRRDVVGTMRRAKGFIRRELGARLGSKHVPDLEFFWDRGLDNALRVEELLQQIAEEDAAKRRGEDS
ncbi:MAG: 30S ribosome-binding factor RbfA [Polyangiales bacterium]|nr:30S ribosome-binding factor RbfA [Myxococcales bacterium]